MQTNGALTYLKQQIVQILQLQVPSRLLPAAQSSLWRTVTLNEDLPNAKFNEAKILSVQRGSGALDVL